MNKKKVDFFLVGQPKSGSTALYNFLSQHPEIIMSSEKEPHYFCFDFHKESDIFYRGKKFFFVRDENSYDKLFPELADCKVSGEASQSYLYSKEAARLIHEYNPAAKIIMFLRHPVYFMHSLHAQNIINAQEDEPDFEKALLKEEARKQGNQVPRLVRFPSQVFYQDRTRYTNQIKRYFDLFPREQIKVIIYEDFLESNDGTYKSILEFLNVNKEFIPELNSYNSSQVPRNNWVNNILQHPYIKRSIRAALPQQGYNKIVTAGKKLLWKKEKRQSIPDELHKQLLEKTFPEVEKVSNYLQVDLLHKWRYL